jgi:hypothetical protein
MQTLKALAFYGAVVNKIFFPGIIRDKSVALLITEPFYLSIHFQKPSCSGLRPEKALSESKIAGVTPGVSGWTPVTPAHIGLRLSVAVGWRGWPVSR